VPRSDEQPAAAAPHDDAAGRRDDPAVPHDVAAPPRADAAVALGGPRPDRVGLATWRSFLGAHAAVIARIEADLAGAGLPPLSWYDVLWALYSAPGRQRRMGELVDHVVLSRTGMTRLVDRIEAAGLLRREPVPGDRRGAFAVVTDEGIGTLRRMWAIYAPRIQELFVEPIGEDAAVLRAALDRVSGSISPEA
jgi:DNA-binding MarR family transcriptional regulator